MNVIQTAYINALLADAAYVSVQDGINTDDMGKRLTPTQAAYLAANFTVLDSYNASSGGFNAVVWQIKAGSQLANTNPSDAGKVFVSMRGTQELQDFLDDAQLAFKGIPYDQIRDMVNWWLKNTAATTNTQVKQIKVIERIVTAVPPINVKTFALDTPTTGTGLLTDLNGIAGVNGHSLGGYLSTAFTRIFGSAWGVESVNTYNSAGFSNVAGLNIAYEYNNIANLLGGNMGTSFSGIDNIQKNYFGVNGINFTTNSAADIGIPGFNQYGERVNLYQEDLLGSGAVGVVNNHLMYKLTDYLALGATLEMLDRNLSFDQLNQLIKAGSQDMIASYEGVLDCLRKMLLGTGIAATQAGDVGDSTAPRPSFHANLKDLQDSDAFKSLEGQLLIRPSSTNLAAAARNDFSALIALQDLSPVWITGKDAAANARLKEIWQISRSADYAAWEADKSASDPNTHTYTFTDQWIADRAALLNWRIQINKDNTEGVEANNKTSFVVASNAIDTTTTFDDIQSKTLITVAKPLSPLLSVKRISFGGDGADEISGGGKADHLYGGAGNDTLNGLAGNDYLEGGGGNDTIDGGEDADIILGGAGNDSLVGGSGNDRLVGGEGNDEIIAGANDDILIGGEGKDQLKGQAGNDILIGGAGDDSLEAGDGNDFLNGGQGQDTLIGGQDNDYLFDQGGSTSQDNTSLQGDGGNDILEITGAPAASASSTASHSLSGGQGNDILSGASAGASNSLDGNSGNDIISGGDQYDIINGGDGADNIAAAGGADRIDGGEGADYMQGGAGVDDYIYSSLNFGTDLIDDTSGTLSAMGSKLSGGSYNINSQAYTAGGYEYRKYSMGSITLLGINRQGDISNTIYIKDWQAGQFGIQLSGQEEEPTKLAQSTAPHPENARAMCPQRSKGRAKAHPQRCLSRKHHPYPPLAATDTVGRTASAAAEFAESDASIAVGAQE